MFNKYFGSENAASKTNRRIALGVLAFILIAGLLLWKDISKMDFGKKKGTEQLLQSSKTQPDVANQNLLSEMRALSEKVEALQQKKNDPQVNHDAQLNEKVERIIADKLAGMNEKNQDAVNPFEAQNGSQDGKQAFPGTEMSGGAETDNGFGAPAEPAEGAGRSSSEKRNGLRRMKNEGSADSQAASDDNKTYLPPGSILSYYTLTGVNAPTNLDSNTKNAPVMLLTVKGNAILPNGFSADLGDCFVTGPVYGQYMDSRAVARTKTISCIREDGKAVEAEITGQINGEDGKPGWQGRTASKTGKALAGLARIGFYQTIADIGIGAASGFNINVGRSSNTNGAARTQINLGGSAGQSVAKNAGTAFEKMAEIYEKRGNEAIPVVEIDAGRTGEIILTQGLTLEFSKEVK